MGRRKVTLRMKKGRRTTTVTLKVPTDSADLYHETLKNRLERYSDVDSNNKTYGLRLKRALIFTLAVIGGTYLLIKGCGVDADTYEQNHRRRHAAVYQTEVAPWMCEHSLNGNRTYILSCPEQIWDRMENHGSRKYAVMLSKKLQYTNQG